MDALATTKGVPQPGARHHDPCDRHCEHVGGHGMSHLAVEAVPPSCLDCFVVVWSSSQIRQLNRSSDSEET